ncbi:MAG: nucleoside monophosphate kinase [Spirochaetes bacterium]|nr:nucleoside monophosphate kinase [Spirochaetota bacterium]
MKVILIGPPGSGKGTQAMMLKERYGAAHISSGEVLRREAARGSELGSRIAVFMARGEIGPVELITEAILTHIDEQAPSGFILDGFPRTLYQAEELGKRHDIDAAIFIDVPETVIVDRILGRRTCGGCGAIFHVRTNPPAREGVCDICGAPLTVRGDDNEETVMNRIRVYKDETVPLLDFYGAAGLLRTVDGNGGADEILSRIEAALPRA